MNQLIGGVISDRQHGNLCWSVRHMVTSGLHQELNTALPVPSTDAGITDALTPNMYGWPLSLALLHTCEETVTLVSRTSLLSTGKRAATIS
jgi:hypothetical protein